MAQKSLKISSSAFSDNGRIPSVYTCDGEDINPPLVFENVPDNCKSLAIIVDDPDSPGKTWAHWIVFNIDPNTKKVDEDTIPYGAIETMTDFGTIGYGGPCPANGVHRYRFKLYALDSTLDFNEDTTKDEIEDAMKDHLIEMTQITGLYSRE